MRDRKVASRYAGALMASAVAEGNLVDVAESYAAVLASVKDNKDLQTFMDSPQVADQEKKDLLKNVFGDKIENLLLHFFFLLIDKNRIENTRDIGEEFAALVEKHEGVVRAIVTTAVTMPADLSASLSEKLSSFTGTRVILENKIDPAVIGGVCVTMDGKILDGTVRSNLDQLRNKLEKTSVR